MTGDGGASLRGRRGLRRRQERAGNGRMFHSPTNNSFAALSGLRIADFNRDGKLDTVSGDTNFVRDNGLLVFLQSNLAIDRASLYYNAIPVGVTSDPKAITLTNVGASPVTFTSVYFTGAARIDYAFTTTCTPELGASCTISVTVTPTRTRSVSNPEFVRRRAGRPATGAVNYSSQLLPRRPSPVDFGIVPVGQSKTVPVTVTNVGFKSVYLRRTVLAGENGTDFSQTNDCPSLTPSLPGPAARSRKPLPRAAKVCGTAFSARKPRTRLPPEIR